MKIVPHLFDSSATNQVAFSESGDAFTELRGHGMNVRCSVRLPGEKSFRDFLNVGASGEYGFSRVATRSYLRAVEGGDSQLELEALFVNVERNTLERISTEGKEPAMQLFIDGSGATCVRTSKDGRYIAVGNGNGQFELWNMDMAPYRLFDFRFVDEVSITDLCFSRTNLELVVATTDGGLYLFTTLTGEAQTLSSENRWPCYSADVQPLGDGIVFGGEGSVIWTLGVKGLDWDKSVEPSENPFQMEECRTFTGVPFFRVPAKPDAFIRCIRTGVGSYVQQVRFLTDELICVLGTEATEVWDISGEEPQVVARQRHDVDCRLLGFGGTREQVLVSLGRPM